MLVSFTANAAADWSQYDVRAQTLADAGNYGDAADAGRAAIEAYLNGDSFNPGQFSALALALAEYQEALGDITAIRRTLAGAVKTIEQHSDGDAATTQELSDIYIRLVGYEQDTGHFRHARRALESWVETTEQLHGPASINAVLARLDQNAWILDHLGDLNSMPSRQSVDRISAQRNKHRHLLEELQQFPDSSARLIYLVYRADFLDRYENDPKSAEADLLQFFEEVAAMPAERVGGGVQRAAGRAGEHLYRLYIDQQRGAEAKTLLKRLAHGNFGIDRDDPIYRSVPEFSDDAETPGIRGRINVDLAISAEGSVAKVSLNSAYGNAEFARDFSAAIRSWVFLPAIDDGKAAPREIISAQFETISPENRRRISARRRSRAR